MPARIIAVQAIVVSILLVVVYVTILKPDDQHHLIGVDAPRGPENGLGDGGDGEPDGDGDDGPGGGVRGDGPPGPTSPETISDNVLAAIDTLIGEPDGGAGAPGLAGGPLTIPDAAGEGGGPSDGFNEWGPDGPNGGHGEPANGGNGGAPNDDQYSDAVTRLISGLNQEP